MGCTSPARVPPITYEEEAWPSGGSAGYRLTTAHYDLYTTVTDDAWRAQLPAFLEQCYAKYCALVLAGDSLSNRLETYLFATRDEWERFTQARFPARAEMYRRIRSGGFSEGPTAVCYELGDRGQTLAVLAHEGMHQILSARSPDPVPAWLNEGLATYCETAAPDIPAVSERAPANVHRINSLRQAMAGDTLMNLTALLDTDAGAVILGGETSKTTTYYAQSWALIVFLRHGAGDEDRMAFGRMMEDLGRGALPTITQAARVASPSPSTTSPGLALFVHYFGDDLEAHSRRYNDYLAELCGFR